MRANPPLWLNPPEAKWVPCDVVSKIDPMGYMVEVRLDGEERSIVVPERWVRLSEETLPTKGNLLVTVVAELPDDTRMLTELPATPVAGSQRIKVSPGSLDPV